MEINIFKTQSLKKVNHFFLISTLGSHYFVNNHLLIYYSLIYPESRYIIVNRYRSIIVLVYFYLKPCIFYIICVQYSLLMC